MAKRRKLEAPSAEDLSRIEDELRRDVARGPMSAPIAQVAADAAALQDTRSAEDRAAAARDKADADKLRSASEAGLVMLELPLDEIRKDAIVRDRVVLDAQELDELKLSIMKGGLRLPIEVYELEEDGDFRYGLISGYRRLMAMTALRDYMQGDRFTTIKAVIRARRDIAGTFAAMIEENEIRSGLSHYERGRIAVIAAQQGAFGSTEEAVNALFPVASKAKRSKIRSFALIHEELGDMLEFPEHLKEADGLAIAAALRDGADNLLRDALFDERALHPGEEAARLKSVLEQLERKPDPARGGRPKKEVSPRNLETGYALRAEQDSKGWMIRINGRQADQELVETVIREVERLLGPPPGRS